MGGMSRSPAVVLLALLVAAASIGAQPPTRRGTTILALRTYPGFYHQQVVSVVGAMRGTPDRATIGTEEASLSILIRDLPEGRVEARGQLLDIGRMSQDDPRLIPFDLLNRVRTQYQDRWPRPGEELVLVIAGTTPPPAATAITAPPLRNVVLEPERFVGQHVSVVGQFRGRNLFGDVPESPVNHRWLFVLRAGDAALWVSGLEPKGKGFNFDPTKRLDAGRWMRTTGTVRTAKGLTWIEGETLDLAQAPDEATEVMVPAPPPPPVEVLFSAPTAEEADVALTARIRLQLSRDLDPASLTGNVRISYVGRAGADDAATELSFATNYTPANRALEIRPTQPWAPFRVVKVEFLEGVKGTDGGPLKPFTLTFTTGGS